MLGILEWMELGCYCVFRGLGVVSGLDLGVERVECDAGSLGGFGG